MLKAFGILRLQKLVFNCILHHMENAEEILSILRTDIRRDGRKITLGYHKSIIGSSYIWEHILVPVFNSDEEEIACLRLDAETCLYDCSRKVTIIDVLHDRSLLEFSNYIPETSADDVLETLLAELSEPVEDVPETASADELETEETTPAVSEVKQCKYCSECIYYKKCTSNAPENMKCKSKDGSCVGFLAVCCEHFISCESIDDIYEEQKNTEPAYEPETEDTTPADFSICPLNKGSCSDCFFYKDSECTYFDDLPF